MTAKKESFVSHYDPNVFYSPIYNKTPTRPGMPVHNLVNYTIKLTVTLKDIGLEGLDSPNIKKPSKNRKQKRQEKLQAVSPRINTFQEKPVPNDNIPNEKKITFDNENNTAFK